jgi:putative SOS response-associated peptidase YedK
MLGHRIVGSYPKCGYLFSLQNKEMFAFAGIIKTWENTDGKKETGFVIITTTPNALVSEIHNRMPVILQSKEDENAWLNPKVTDAKMLLPLLQLYPFNKMKVKEVSREINKPDTI